MIKKWFIVFFFSFFFFFLFFLIVIYLFLFYIIIFFLFAFWGGGGLASNLICNFCSYSYFAVPPCVSNDSRNLTIAFNSTFYKRVLFERWSTNICQLDEGWSASVKTTPWLIDKRRLKTTPIMNVLLKMIMVKQTLPSVSMSQVNSIL